MAAWLWTAAEMQDNNTTRPTVRIQTVDSELEELSGQRAICIQGRS